jgi:PAS domain S-box-containing protein
MTEYPSKQFRDKTIEAMVTKEARKSLLSLDEKQLAVLSPAGGSGSVREEGSIDLAFEALQNTPECVMLTSANATIIDVNRAFCITTGYSKDEVIGKRPSVLSSGKHSRTFYDKIWADLNIRGHWRGRVTNRKKSGEIYTEELAIHTVLERDSQVYYIGIFYDVSDRMALEEAQKRNQRLASVGTLVGGIAHNFNNMLAGISGNLYLAAKYPDDAPKVKDKLQKIQMQVNSAAGLIKQLMDFSRQSSKQLSVVDINAFISQFHVLHSAVIPGNILFELHLAATKGWVNCDQVELEQVLLNLIINATHALKDVGSPKITITTTFGVEVVDAASNEKCVYNLIAVADNGCGIPLELQDKIFEPFFSTREEDMGTGLGLATAYGSISAMSGHINLISTLGEGTVFNVYLPIHSSKESVASSSMERSFDKCVSADQSILIVDDNVQLCETLSEIFKDDGYEIYTANNGEQALKLFRKEAPVLILTDAIMPIIDGFELARIIHEDNERLPVIVMSGYSSEFIGPQIEDPFVWLINKPFAPEQVRQLIAKCLPSI